ncbi:hypothetical protein NKH77_55205 [Streptomyces sp. M19]
MLSRFYDPQSGSVHVGAPGGAADVREVRLSSLRSAVGSVFEDPSSSPARCATTSRTADRRRATLRWRPPPAPPTPTTSSPPSRRDTPPRWGARHGALGRPAAARGPRPRPADEPRVLVLDDATSAVDPATEAVIHDALRGAATGRTTVLIAHRRSTLSSPTASPYSTRAASSTWAPRTNSPSGASCSANCSPVRAAAWTSAPPRAGHHTGRRHSGLWPAHPPTPRTRGTPPRRTPVWTSGRCAPPDPADPATAGAAGPRSAARGPGTAVR